MVGAITNDAMEEFEIKNSAFFGVEISQFIQRLIEKLTTKYSGRKFLIISDNAGVHQTISVNKVL